VDGQALTPNVAYTVTGDTIISYLSEFLDTLAAQTYTTAVSFSNGFLEQGALVIKE